MGVGMGIGEGMVLPPSAAILLWVLLAELLRRGLEVALLRGGVGGRGRSSAGYNRLSPEEQELTQRVRQLRAQAAPLNTPDTFAAFAKIQRIINSAEQQLSQLQAIRQQQAEVSPSPSNLLDWREIVSSVLLASQVIIWFVIVFTYYGKPIATVPPSSLQPLARLLAFPHGFSKGSIAVLPWLALSVYVSKSIARRVLPTS
eukprot:jgi/Chlat1/1101/Chrsp110S01583